MGGGISGVMLVGRFLEVVVKNLWQHFMFKFVHGFGFFDLNKNILREYFELTVERPHSTAPL